MSDSIMLTWLRDKKYSDDGLYSKGRHVSSYDRELLPEFDLDAHLAEVPARMKENPTYPFRSATDGSVIFEGTRRAADLWRAGHDKIWNEGYHAGYEAGKKVK